MADGKQRQRTLAATLALTLATVVLAVFNHYHSSSHATGDSSLIALPTTVSSPACDGDGDEPCGRILSDESFGPASKKELTLSLLSEDNEVTHGISHAIRHASKIRDLFHKDVISGDSSDSSVINDQ